MTSKYNEDQFNNDINELLKGKKYSEEEIQSRINEIKSTYPDVEIQRICSYGRVSTKHDEQESSLFTQNIMFHNFCESHKKDGYVLVEEIYDRHSATVASKRKKFIQMIERARAGEFNILLFKDSKRFSRNNEDFLRLIEDLKRESIYVMFMSEGVNSKTADRMTLSVLGMIAESHSNGLHTSVTAAIEVNMNKPEGRMPAYTFGYDKPVVGDCKVAYINKTEAELITEMFTRLKNNEGYASIVRDWRLRGIKTKTGRDVTIHSLKRMARNKKYIGVIEMHKSYKEDVRSEKKKTDPSEWIVTYRDDLRIIDDKLFYDVQDILDERKRPIDKKCLVRDRPFTSIIKCGCCGKTFRRTSGGSAKAYDYFGCTTVKDRNKVSDGTVCFNTKNIRQDVLYKCMEMYFIELLKNQDDIEKLIKERLAIIIKENKKKVRGKTGKTSLSEVEEASEKFERAKELFIEGLIGKTKLDQLKKELEELQKKHRAESINQLDQLDVNELYNKFIGTVESLVKKGLEKEESIDGVAFNNLFDSIVACESGELIINFKIQSSLMVYTDGR